MAEVTAAMVKQLRDQTQLPMMKCKKALVEADGDMEAAKEALRKDGEKFIEGRGERSTEEGRVAIYTSPAAGAIVELRVESVQSASNEDVVQLAKDLAEQLAAGPGAATPDELWEQPCPSQSGNTLKAVRDEIANRIREVFRLERIARIDGPCGGYVHHDGKTGVLLHAEGGDADLAKNIGMQIVSMRPAATTKAELDKDLVAKEEAIQKERARQEGKPENIIEKMIQGRMKSFYAEKVLEEQPYIKDDKQTVGKVAEAGGMKLIGFVRWEVGETTTAQAAAAAAG